ncbi:MAG: hypothetical protein QXP80_00660 [Zestosphaera sp.]
MKPAVELRIPYRLHLGFYRYNDPPYLFGSTGVAVSEPYFTIKAERVEGPIIVNTPTEESREVITETLIKLGIKEGVRVSVEGLVKHHVGLGSRTKLVIGVLKALRELKCLRPGAPIKETANALGLGRVSGIGIYTFLMGGFVVDTGVAVEGEVVKHPELLLRLKPPSWSIVIAVPEGVAGLHGRVEESILNNAEPHQKQEELYRLLANLITAVRFNHFKPFSEALSKIQVLAGQYFSKYQGGMYSSEESCLIAEALRKSGVEAIGQSSWGPTIYCFTEDRRKAIKSVNVLKDLRSSLRLNFWVTRVSGRGHYVENSPS